MDDLISRQAAIDAVHCRVEIKDKVEAMAMTSAIAEIVRNIAELPSAEPERKTERWIEQEEYWECPECKDQFVLEVGVTPKDARMFYCPNCGSKMERSK